MVGVNDNNLLVDDSPSQMNQAYSCNVVLLMRAPYTLTVIILYIVVVVVSVNPFVS